MNYIDIIAQMGDLKDTDYKNTLAISVLIELLIEKNLFTRQDFAHKAWAVEKSTLTEITAKHRLELLHTLPSDVRTSQV